MSTIKLEIPAYDKKVLTAFGNALITLAGDGAKQEAAVEPTKPAAIIVADKPAEPTNVETSETQDFDPDLSDNNGIPFNSEYCGQSKTPFYGSGSRMGQWKKRRGLDDQVYDEWYAEQLTAVKSGNSGDDLDYGDDAPVDTAGAFAEPSETVETQYETPADVGSFMAWVAEMKVAEKLSESDVSEAYSEAGVQVNDLFNLDTAVAQTSREKVYNALLGKLK